MGDTAYEAEYLEGIERFNRHDFFEAHEVWESIWKRSTPPHRLFYKGLIHAAVALHHWGNGNAHGARKVLGSCLQYLEAYCPRHLGLDVDAFLAELRRCFSGLLSGPLGHAPPPFDPAAVPRIELDRAGIQREGSQP